MKHEASNRRNWPENVSAVVVIVNVWLFAINSLGSPSPFFPLWALVFSHFVIALAASIAIWRGRFI